ATDDQISSRQPSETNLVLPFSGRTLTHGALIGLPSTEHKSGHESHFPNRPVGRILRPYPTVVKTSDRRLRGTVGRFRWTSASARRTRGGCQITAVEGGRDPTYNV